MSKLILRLSFLSLLAGALFIVGCNKDDDDPKPDVQPIPMLMKALMRYL